MSWRTYPHGIECPIALAWRGDGRAVAVASDERVEVVELDRIGARRLDARFDDVVGLSFDDEALVVRDGDQLHRFDPSGVRLASERSAEPESGALAGFEPDEILEVARDSTGRAALVRTDDGVFLARGERPPRWLADHGPMAFAGVRPIVDDVVFSPAGDPRRLLEAGGYPLSPDSAANGPDGAVAFACMGVVHVVEPGDLTGADRLPGLADGVTDLTASEQHLAAISESEVVVFDRAAGIVAARWQTSIAHEKRVAFLDPETLLVGGNAVEVWRWRTRERLDRWALELSGIRALRCSRNRVLIAGYDEVALLSTTGELIASHAFDAPVRAADLHPVEPRIAVALGDGPLLLLADSGELLGELPSSEAVLLDGDRVWASDYDVGRALPWPPGDQPPSLEPFERAERADGGVLLASHRDVTRCDDAGGELWSSIYRDGVGAITAASGERFYTSGESPWIAERRLADGTLSRVLPAGTGAQITALALSADGGHLAVGDENGRVAIWELGDGVRRIGMADSSNMAEIDRFEPGLFGEITAVAFGSELVALGEQLLRWKGPLVGDIGSRGPTALETDAACLAASGELIATAEWDQPIEIVEVRTGEVLSRVPEPEALGGLEPAFSPAGDRLLIASDSAATVWSTADGALIGRVDVDRRIGGAAFAMGAVVLWFDRSATGPGRPGLAVRWDPESSAVERWLELPLSLSDARGLCAAGDRALLWFDDRALLVEGSAAIAVLPPHRESINAAALSPSGIAATGDDSGVVRIWDRAGGLVTELCSTADASWWRSGPEFHWEPSANLREDRW